MKKFLPAVLVALLAFSACKKDPVTTDKMLRIKVALDPAQERLGTLGNVETVPTGNAAQNPSFRGFSAHFIELIPNEFTLYGKGEELYKGVEVASDNTNPFGFTTAADFDQAIVVADGETFIEIPLADIEPGTYRHLRVSVIYQNYDIKFNLNNVPVIGDLTDQSGTVASFVGYNNFITDLTVRDDQLAVNDERLQGFWAFETDLASPYESYNQIVNGQAPTTTVVNPFPNAPIPLGSCVVTGSMDENLVISGQETEDIVLTLSFSTNQSFEWVDSNNNGEWDLDAANPQDNEPVVDMGLRGLIGKVGN